MAAHIRVQVLRRLREHFSGVLCPVWPTGKLIDQSVGYLVVYSSISRVTPRHAKPAYLWLTELFVEALMVTNRGAI